MTDTKTAPPFPWRRDEGSGSREERIAIYITDNLTQYSPPFSDDGEFFAIEDVPALLSFIAELDK